MAKTAVLKPFLAVAKDKFTINTIEDMIGRRDLALGDVVELNGYYTAGDGAGHKRKIEANDDGSGVLLANGLWANIVPSQELRMTHFGLKDTGYGQHDDTLVVQKYIDFMFKNNMKAVLECKKCWTTDTIWLKGDVYGVNSGFECSAGDKPFAYVGSSIKKIEGLTVNFYSPDMVGNIKPNRYMLLVHNVNRKSLTGLKQAKGYGVIKQALPEDKELILDPQVKDTITNGTFTNTFFSNVVEILHAILLSGTGLNLQASGGGNTGNYFPTAYFNRDGAQIEGHNVPMILLTSSGAGNVFDQLNIEWCSCDNVIQLVNSEVVVSKMYSEGVVLTGDVYKGYFSALYSSSVNVKTMELGHCVALKNTNILVVDENGDCLIDFIKFTDYEPKMNWNNVRVNTVFFLTFNRRFTKNTLGNVEVGRIVKKGILNADNVCVNRGVYLFEDYEGMMNNTNSPINHPLKKIGGIDRGIRFLGRLKEDNSTSNFITKDSFKVIDSNDSLMVTNEGFVALESGIYEIKFKIPFVFGVRLLLNTNEIFIAQGDEVSNKNTFNVVTKITEGQVIKIQSVVNGMNFSADFGGFVSINKKNNSV